ncbi:MAG TPA: ABC transporter permease [Candidatus Methanoperedens sp.]|nr:ABC transporter permease [Candidatus Methanoperedens sp.]
MAGWIMLEVLAITFTVFLVILSAAYARRFGIGKEILLAGTRALVQILMLASIILILFRKPLFWSFLVLMMMAAIAGHTTYSRSGKLEMGLPVAFVSITIASLLLLIPFFLVGIFPPEARYIVPTGSILIGNAMNVSSLAIDRYKGEIKNRRAEVETYLALGARPEIAVKACLKQGILSALIPSIDNMKNLGIVWIPGVMTGMLLGGADPMEAASIQIAIFTSIFATGMIASGLLLHFSTDSFFTKAAQLKEDMGQEL